MTSATLFCGFSGMERLEGVRAVSWIWWQNVGLGADCQSLMRRQMLAALRALMDSGVVRGHCDLMFTDTYIVCLRRNFQGSAFGLAWLLSMLMLAGCGGSSGVSMPSFSSSDDTENMFISAAATWDLNKDGTVTCDEWKSYTGDLVQGADANNDQVLNKEEYASLARTDRLFDVATLSYFDSNKDGQLTHQEITGKPNPAFVRLDRDKDCTIGRNEIVVVRGKTPVPKSKKNETVDPTTQGPGRR